MSRPASPLREPLLAHIMAGGIPKEFCYSHRMARPNVQKLLWAMGLKKYYLTAAEHAEVLARRKARATREERVAA